MKGFRSKSLRIREHYVGMISYRGYKLFEKNAKDFYAKYHGFGIPIELLDEKLYDFIIVVVHYQGFHYIAKREQFVQSNKIDEFDYGKEVYLNIKEFKKYDPNQYEAFNLAAYLSE
jgi:hypothetical protein